MADTPNWVLQLDGYHEFQIEMKAENCMISATSSDNQLSIKIELASYTIHGLIDEIEQVLVGPPQKTFAAGVRGLELIQQKDNFILTISAYDTTFKLLFKNKRDLGKLSQTLKSASSWTPEKSRLVSREVWTYIDSKTNDEIASEICNLIKQELSSSEQLAVFDVDAVDNYIHEFWKRKGTDWIRVYTSSTEVSARMEEIENKVANTISDETIRAQNNLVDKLARELAGLAIEKKLERVSKKGIEDFLRSKDLTLPDRIRQRIYIRANTRMDAMRRL